MLKFGARAALLATLAVAGAFAQAQPGGYPPIALDDLKVDIKQMMGKRVAVKAQLQTMGELSMLKSDPVDMTPLWAVTDALPREDRKKLTNGCQLVTCSGTFYGVVKKGPLGPAVTLDKVDWR